MLLKRSTFFLIFGIFFSFLSACSSVGKISSTSGTAAQPLLQRESISYDHLPKLVKAPSEKNISRGIASVDREDSREDDREGRGRNKKDDHGDRDDDHGKKGKPKKSPKVNVTFRVLK